MLDALDRCRYVDCGEEGIKMLSRKHIMVKIAMGQMQVGSDGTVIVHEQVLNVS